MLVSCMNLKKIGKVFTSKFVETGPSSYKKRIYWAAVLQRLRNSGLRHFMTKLSKTAVLSEVASMWFTALLVVESILCKGKGNTSCIKAPYREGI